MKRSLGVALLTCVLAAGAPVAHAAFFGSATASSSFSTDTLAGVPGLSATAQCGALQYEIALSWTATTSTWADGYEVSMATASTGPYDVVALPLGADPLATSRVVGNLSAGTRYWFQVTATKGGWRSTAAQVDQTTSAVCVL